MVLLLVLNVLFGKVLSDVQVFHNFTLTLGSDTQSDDIDCTKGQKLLVYDNALPAGIRAVCNDIDTDQIDKICQKLDKCSGEKGVVTNVTDPSPYPLYITSDTFTFYSDPFKCGTYIVCYDTATHCYLPKLENGHYKDSTNTIYDKAVLDSGSRLDIQCDKNYAWRWADFVTCVAMSSGESQLSSDPLCVPLSADNKMTLLVDVDNKAHLIAMTGVDGTLVDPDNSESILHPDQQLKLDPFCNDKGICSIPTHHFTVPTPESKEDEPDHVALLLGKYTMCFDTSIITIFLMGLQEMTNKNVYKDFDVRPVKREIVDNNIEARIEGLDLVYNSTDRTVSSINVTFYLFQYNRVIPPSVVTKIMGNVSRDKYDIVLESYCRLKYCESETYNECGDIPTMTFNSFPKPATPCSFQGKQLSYATPIPMVCDPNQYNNESEITLCLYGNQYSPPVLPKCAQCGGSVYTDSFYGPSRTNGLNARGANCVWEIKTSHNNTGQFYQTSKGDAKTCSDPVDYLTITEYDTDDNILKEITNICYGVPMKLGPRFTVRLTSNENSEVDRRFIFEFEPDLPHNIQNNKESHISAQPWYKRYMAIIIAAPIIVIFFVALVFIGVWCDHKNKQKSTVIQMEYGDHISNGTWKANESFKKSSVIEDDAISPQPRIHNAVTKPDQQKKRRKKRRATPKTDSATQQMTDSLTPPTYDTWVVVSNPSNQGTSPDTIEYNSPEAENYAGSQVFHSPARQSGVKSSTTVPSHSDNVRTTSGTEGSAVIPRKKRRRKKRSNSVQRPLPALNGGEDLEASTYRNHKTLPPLSKNIAKEQSNRALPPIANKNVDGSLSKSYPYVPVDLGID